MPTKPQTLRPRHAQAKRVERPRESAYRRGYNKRWQAASKGWLRHHPLCVYCEAEGRTTEAQCVDHIVSHRGDQGLFWDRGNWQSLCNACHGAKTVCENGLKPQWQGGSTGFACQVTVVSGKPASGKSTYVRQHAQQGDVIWDWDAVLQAITIAQPHERIAAIVPFVAAMRDALLLRLKRPNEVKAAWIIVSDPMNAAKLVSEGATLKHITCDEAERQRRLAARGGGPKS